MPLCHRRLAFREIYGQSMNSVHYIFPFHGRVYRQKQMIAARGITFKSSPPDAPDQNSFAERFGGGGGGDCGNCTNICIQSNLPRKPWPHVVTHFTSISNRIPVQRIDWKTPFEMVHGRQPDLSHLRIIGSRAYVLFKNRRDRPARAKL